MHCHSCWEFYEPYEPKCGCESVARCRPCHMELAHDCIVLHPSVSVPMPGLGGVTGFYGKDSAGAIGDESPWQDNAIRAMEDGR